MTNYSYQPPSESNFKINLASSFPELAPIINNICIEFKDIGYAHYYDRKDHGWNVNGIILSFTGSDCNIIKLKQIAKATLQQQCNKVIPSGAGLAVVDINYIIQEQENNFQAVPNEVEEKIRLISTRNADFDGMAIDEKLALLNNLIENLLKIDGKYINPDYTKLFFGYINGSDVKGYRGQTQCFRHATQEDMLERQLMPHSKKEFLCDMGIFIAIHIYKHS